jgi:hypothetical protein
MSVACNQRILQPAWHALCSAIAALITLGLALSAAFFIALAFCIPPSLNSYDHPSSCSTSQAYMCATSPAVCPLNEDLQWRQQLADVTGPPDQDALPPLDRKVRHTADFIEPCAVHTALHAGMLLFRSSSCSAMCRASGRPSPTVFCRSSNSQQLKCNSTEKQARKAESGTRYTYSCRCTQQFAAVLLLQGALWDWYRQLYREGWNLDANSYSTAFRCDATHSCNARLLLAGSTWCAWLRLSRTGHVACRCGWPHACRGIPPGHHCAALLAPDHCSWVLVTCLSCKLAYPSTSPVSTNGLCFHTCD